jgi:hypothetical protein
MGKAYRLVMHELTLRDIMDVRSDPKYRLTTSPFGVTPEQYERNPPIYVGGAVSWKGVKGDAFWAIADKHVGKKGIGLGNALRKAIKISKACAGVYGTVLFNGKLYPKKCIEQKKSKA